VRLTVAVWGLGGVAGPARRRAGPEKFRPREGGGGGQEARLFPVLAQPITSEAWPSGLDGQGGGSERTMPTVLGPTL